MKLFVKLIVFISPIYFVAAQQNKAGTLISQGNIQVYISKTSAQIAEKLTLHIYIPRVLYKDVKLSESNLRKRLIEIEVKPASHNEKSAGKTEKKPLAQYSALAKISNRDFIVLNQDLFYLKAGNFQLLSQNIQLVKSNGQSIDFQLPTTTLAIASSLSEKEDREFKLYGVLGLAKDYRRLIYLAVLLCIVLVILYLTRHKLKKIITGFFSKKKEIVFIQPEQTTEQAYQTFLEELDKLRLGYTSDKADFLALSLKQETLFLTLLQSFFKIDAFNYSYSELKKVLKQVGLRLDRGLQNELNSVFSDFLMVKYAKRKPDLALIQLNHSKLEGLGKAIWSYNFL